MGIENRDESKWPPKACLDAIEGLMLYSDHHGQAGMDETATPNDRLRIARQRNEACGRLHDAIRAAVAEAERRGREQERERLAAMFDEEAAEHEAEALRREREFCSVAMPHLLRAKSAECRARAARIRTTTPEPR